MNDDEQEQLNRRRWKNRRRMAWIAFVAAIVYVPLVAKWPSLEGIAGAFFSFCGAVVAVYIGGSVVDDNWNKGL